MRVSSTDRPRLPPAVVDWLMAILTAAAFLGAASISPEDNTIPVDATAVFFALVLGGALLFRRRWPLGVFVGSLVIITVYSSTDAPGAQASRAGN